jgi:UDP-N-acetylmuramate--alanine ligase
MKSQPSLGHRVHLCGIGGIGMSAIAQLIAQDNRIQIQGSNDTMNANVERLRSLGINVFLGHNAKHLHGIDTLVYSTAISPNNPEMVYARDNNIRILHRSEILTMLTRSRNNVAIAGSHGKTTTTALVAHILRAINIKPLMIVGGIVNDLSNNFSEGQTNWSVIESDESDGSFVRLPHDIAVITNIDHEHLKHYGDNMESLIEHFVQFANDTSADGAVIVNTDCRYCNKLLLPRIKHDRIITFGVKPTQNSSNCAGSVSLISRSERYRDSMYTFDLSYRINNQKQVLRDVRTSLHGKHNISNTIGAVTAVIEVMYRQQSQVTDVQAILPSIIDAAGSFKGVNRRFSILNNIRGTTIVDDYAHHPTEIKSTIDAARQFLAHKSASTKIAVVFQPHRYSRTQALMEDFASCFAKIDCLYLTPIYEASESAEHYANCRIEDVATKISKSTQAPHEVHIIDDIRNVVDVAYKDILNGKFETGGLILFMGAGNITEYAKQLASMEAQDQIHLRSAVGAA